MRTQTKVTGFYGVVYKGQLVVCGISEQEAIDFANLYSLCGRVYTVVYVG